MTGATRRRAASMSSSVTSGDVEAARAAILLPVPSGIPPTTPPPNSPSKRPARGPAVVGVAVIAAAMTVLAGACGDSGKAPGPAQPLSPSTAPGAGPATPQSDLPPAPWRSVAVARSAVPPDYVKAWDRDRNRATCALLFPLDGGPQMDGAKATEEKTADDNGWDIFWKARAGIVEVLGAFPKDLQSTDSTRSAGTPGFTKMWADGAVAKYGAEPGPANADPGDANGLPHEAKLTLADQRCVYQIKDSLGRAHLEAIFDRLRLMAP